MDPFTLPDAADDFGPTEPPEPRMVGAIVLPDRPDWMRAGRCVDVDPAVMFPTGQAGRSPGATTLYLYDPAKAICEGCPSAAECLRFALANREPAGVWGGCDPFDRSQMLTVLNAVKPAWGIDPANVKPGQPAPRVVKPGATHGTRQAYVHGCRCQPCTTANTVYVREHRRAA